MTAEHQCLAENIDIVLRNISASSLLGIMEVDRKQFDYGCILQRDFSRPLMSQVLWKNPEGIEKDLRNLILGSDAKLKLYVFKDSVKARSKISEITKSYTHNKDLAKHLRGLRFFPIPPDFDADKEENRKWIYTHLRSTFTEDLLFQIIFGHFRLQDFKLFCHHNSALGLKYIVLDEIVQNGLIHTSTFKKQLGYSTTGPLKQCIIMLKGAGFIKTINESALCMPTIKGRLFLDLSKKLLFEYYNYSDWSNELELIFEALSIPIPAKGSVIADLNTKTLPKSDFEFLLLDLQSAKTEFERDLLKEIDKSNPQFHSEDYIDQIKRKFLPYAFKGGDIKDFTDEDSLLYLTDFSNSH